MPAIRIPGVPDPVVKAPSLAETVEGITPVKNVRVEAGRADARIESLEGEFVEIELTEGVRLWAPTDQINADLGAGPARDGGAPVLPTTLALSRGATRGRAADIAIQAVRTFELQIAGAIADFIKNRVEAGREPGGRLQQCVTSSAAAFEPVGKIPGTGPVLVFVHGTASSTDGSFGGLWEAIGANRLLRLENPGARINDLFKHYDGRVLAFEHRSLSESPVLNALALVEQLAEVLPGGREVHLVSHSRGGLIGELFCRGMRSGPAPFDATDLKLFEGDNRKSDRDALQELSRILKAQRYQVGRFVRVACPAAGTTLADGRLDRYVSILVNVAGKIGGLAANPAYQALTSLLAAVLKERTKPESLPGLEAMMPISPLARMVNRRDAQTEADLHVLGGDLAIGGVVSALKALVTDFYYREDHDLVVNTPSMLRGTPRGRTVKYWIDTGGEVSHFNYFRNSDTATRLADILVKGTADLHDLEVQPDAVDENAYQKRDATPRPVLVLVPGFMGSHLARDGRVWADAQRLAKGGFASLASGDVEPDALVGPYTSLVEYLSATHDVAPFTYDWRKPAAESAAALGAFIKARLPKGDDASALPLRVLTHGAGGFVFEALLASKEGRALWDTVSAQAGSRAVILGYPFGGTVQALLPLLDRGPLLEGLAAVDLASDRKKLRSTLAGFEGLLELLPDVDAATWKAAKDATVPDAKRLAAAAARRDAHTRAAAFDRDRLVLVAGSADATPVDVTMAGDATNLVVTPDGDGYSTWDAIPDGLRRSVLVAPVDYGGLVTTRELHPAIVELLTIGRSPRLTTLPARAQDRGMTLGAARPRPTAPLHRLQQIPSDAELVASGLGVEARKRIAARRRIQVRVVHGNLSRASWPVVVGHYANDAIVSAEAYLDGQLHGRLRRRLQMQLYPDAIGTGRVEIQPQDAVASVHPGAIVVGLGVVGALTPGGLQQTIEHGLVAYGAERVAERLRLDSQPRDRSGRNGRGADATVTEIPAPVTSLLVGSGEAGLTMRDSLHGLLRAVRGANIRLAAPAEAAREAGEPVPITARISALDIYELYEDRAVEAMRTLVDLMQNTEIGDSFEAGSELTPGADGQQRVSFEEKESWWQRLKVTEHDASIDPEIKTGRRVLKFEAFTERARIDAYAVNSLRQQADAFIANAVGTVAANQNIGKALFEILVPNAIKDRAPDQRSTVLLLDTRSAAIPWELFEDGLQTDRRPRGPLAIEAGLVRQLVDEHGRQQVRQAPDRTALVVGDPIVDDDRFAPLPGAEAEANAVAAQLAGRYDVKSLVKDQAKPQAILAALHERPWQVVHLAMHGVIDFPIVDGGKELVTGAVAGKGAFLTTDDFNQMRYVPDLVFLNCCFGGSAAADARRPVPRYPELAANLAIQFIKMGAKAVVAAGWAVDDGAAQAFARSFYTNMLGGQSFGEATLRARQEIYRRFPHVNTWGAYQCYGDPTFHLDGQGTGGAGTPPFTVREVVVAVRRLASQARTGNEAGMASVRKQLDEMVGRTSQRWLEDAQLCAELGNAYGELREFASAIDYYRRAIKAEKATLPVSALEQLANLQSRSAEQMWRDAKKPTDALRREVEALFADARADLQRLIDFAPSAERLSILGGLEKRYAMTREKREDIATALAAMADRYGEACAITAERNPGGTFYPFINKVVGRLAHSWLEAGTASKAGAKAGAKGKAKAGKKAAPETTIEEDLKTLATYADEQAKQTDFWSTAFVAEAALVTALAGGDPAGVTDADRVADYRRAEKRGRSGREMDSVVTQIRFLARMAGKSPDKAVNKLGAALDGLVRQLTGD